MFIAAAQVTVETSFTNPAQTAEPRFAFFVKAYENNIAVSLVPALIKPSGLDAVVDHLRGDPSFFEIVHHSLIIGSSLRQKQMLGLLNTPPETVPLDRTNGAPRPLKWCVVTASMVH